MKKKYLKAILISIVTFQGAFAQDIEVVGFGSQPALERNEKLHIDSPVGGSKPSDYKVIDEPAYECIYNYTISKFDKTGEPVKENYATILLLGKNAGRFTDYSTYRTDSIVFAANSDEEKWQTMALDAKKTEFKFTGDILLNYPPGELTYTDVVLPGYEEYTETFPPIQWQLEEAQDTVCGYLCTKATGSYGGRDWEVWFAEEIPSDLGPWKFSGLPGLVMAAKDSEGIHEFKAISFREGTTPIAKPNNPLIQKTNRDNFIGKKQLVESDPFKHINPETIQEIYVIKDRVIINGVEKPRRPNGYTPIELK